MADQQGTGKHPHKSAAEPYPHTKDGKDSGGRHQTRNSTESGQERSQGGGGSSDDRAREYRGADGEVHHHTKKYMEEHGSGR